MEIVGFFFGLWNLWFAYKSFNRGYVSEWKKTHKTGRKFFKYDHPHIFWTHIIAHTVLGIGVIVLCLINLNLAPNEFLPKKGPVFPVR